MAILTIGLGALLAGIALSVVLGGRKPKAPCGCADEAPDGA